MSDPSPLLIYGSTGYTGRLVVTEALRHGLRPTIAGRTRELVEAQAAETGLEARVFPVEAPDLHGIRVLLNCAGPFSRTARPLVDACLAAGVHYLDITGEIAVFEALAARDAEARGKGVMLLPGAGYDVVPSDCLAAHVAARVPGATDLVIAMAQKGGLSHGTATTILTHMDQGGAVRRGGRIVPDPMGEARLDVDFGDKVRTVTRIPWGDVSTAFHSTGIPDIAVYALLPGASLPAWVTRAGSRLLAWPPVRRFAQARVDAAPPGPSDEVRARGGCRLWARATAPDGRSATSRLVTPEGYTLTARTAVDLATRALDEATPGFTTPSRWRGADYILGFDCAREDV